MYVRELGLEMIGQILKSNLSGSERFSRHASSCVD